MPILGQSLKIHGGPVVSLWLTANSCSTAAPAWRGQNLGEKTAGMAEPPRVFERGEPQVSRTARVFQLNRRLQLSQIFEEIEIAKEQHGKLNKIVMNAVMEACAHCGDIESALKLFYEMSNPEGLGVDSITYGTLIKGLGNAEAFQLLEAVENTAAGGDILRANALLARYGYVIQEGGNQTILFPNVGYITSGCPSSALGVYEEILKHGMSPDKLSYNTLVFPCIRNGNLDAATQFFEQMKVSSACMKGLFGAL